MARTAFPPIADYGFLSDCEVSALVAPSGSVEWLCLPQFDSPSVVCPILDRDVGRFRIGPADVQVPAARRYLPGSMVLETTWKTRTGWLVVRDALAIGPWVRWKPVGCGFWWAWQLLQNCEPSSWLKAVCFVSVFNEANVSVGAALWHVVQPVASACS